MGSVYNRKQQLQHDVVTSARRWYRGCVAHGETEDTIAGELQRLFRRVRTLEDFGMTALSSGQVV